MENIEHCECGCKKTLAPSGNIICPKCYDEGLGESLQIWADMIEMRKIIQRREARKENTIKNKK